ncbi:hypothetical protein P280DRAFT_76822 [Massarina eburnea CBS 473.64]|uniref:Uncharacterized protein n=1 Tax=Massarina eburnea CBS 473.64 TaxID=1395130 RepID=A0A6A6RW82_9PLEO|nr:hypothetical protein P280DRAFT_76822 [Massarina eburnea CBS 473.64]
MQRDENTQVLDTEKCVSSSPSLPPCRRSRSRSRSRSRFRSSIVATDTATPSPTSPTPTSASPLSAPTPIPLSLPSPSPASLQYLPGFSYDSRPASPCPASESFASGVEAAESQAVYACTLGFCFGGGGGVYGVYYLDGGSGGGGGMRGWGRGRGRRGAISGPSGAYLGGFVWDAGGGE